MNLKTLIAPIALASTYAVATSRKQSEFIQEYAPNWPTHSPEEVAEIESRIAEAEVAMFSDYYSFVGLDQRGWIAFAIDNNRQRAVGRYEADHATFMYDGESGFVDIAGYGKYETEDQALLHVPDSPDFTFERSETETIVKSTKHDLTLRFGALNAHFHENKPDASIIMGIAPATLSWQGRELTGDIVGERLGFKDFDRRDMGSMLAKQSLSNRSFQGLYLMTEYGEIIYLRASTMEMGLVGGPSAVGFGQYGDHSGMLSSLSITADQWRSAPGLYKVPRAWTATWGTDRKYLLTLAEVDSKVYTNWGLGGFVMSFVEGTLTSEDGESSRIGGLAELILP